MTNRFYFQIFSSLFCGKFSVQLDSLEKQLVIWMMEQQLLPEMIIQARVYLTDAVNQWEEVKKSDLYKDILSMGALSYVEQPLLNGAKVALQVWFSDNEHMVKSSIKDGMKITLDGISYLFQTVRFLESEVTDMDAQAQTELAFQRHVETLSQEGMSLEEHCQRTWLYVRDIDRHYTGVVTGRNRIFEQHGLTADTHYISSTGIGGYFDNRGAIVGVDFLSVKGLHHEQIKYLHALDYLNPTHEYGVAFERGTRLSLPQGEMSLISGTASIDKKGNCVHCGDVLTQTGRLFLNIEKLLEDGGSNLQNIRYMIVYLRDIADYSDVENYLRIRFPKIPFLITEARVCRPGWLIEVECIALKEV